MALRSLPDEETLYLTDASVERPAWIAYNVYDDGTIGNGRVLYDAKPFKQVLPGGPDGLKVDRHGNIFPRALEASTCSRQTPPCSAALSSEFYRKLRLRRRWLNLIHHRQYRDLPNSTRHQGSRVLTAA
jgi:hypothetical protein